MTSPQLPRPFERCTPVSTGRLYTDLAQWWHLLSAPADYAAAAAFYWETILSALPTRPCTMLELGSGGGNNASHLKRHCSLTLVDRSTQMIEQSRSINPECEHIAGDMRTVRLGRQFDAVFVQDAISYMATEGDLEQAVRTAFIHCTPGGVALFAPDYVRESFRPSTSHGGSDGDDGHGATRRGVRYLEWTWDPDPDDSTYLVDFAYMLRDERGELRVESDRLQLGLFARAEWTRIIADAGFEARTARFTEGEDGPGADVLLGVRPR